MKKIKSILLFSAALLISCGSDPDYDYNYLDTRTDLSSVVKPPEPVVTEIKAPEINYEDLYRSDLGGYLSIVPTIINWNGDEGAIKLNASNDQFKIDNNGVITWKHIPEGKYALEITLENSKGKVSDNFELEIVFGGLFKMIYNYDPESFEGPMYTMYLYFGLDGELWNYDELFWWDNIDTGSWQWDTEEDISGNFYYPVWNSDSTNYTIQNSALIAKVIRDGNIVNVIGKWYKGTNISEDEVAGNLTMYLEP